jgi:hypothetical protein
LVRKFIVNSAMVEIKTIQALGMIFRATPKLSVSVLSVLLEGSVTANPFSSRAISKFPEKPSIFNSVDFAFVIQRVGGKRLDVSFSAVRPSHQNCIQHVAFGGEADIAGGQSRTEAARGIAGAVLGSRRRFSPRGLRRRSSRARVL